MFLPVLAALIVLAELVGAVLFAVNGSWIVAVLLVVGIVATVLVVARVFWPKPNPRPGYIEHERTYF